MYMFMFIFTILLLGMSLFVYIYTSTLFETVDGIESEISNLISNEKHSFLEK